MRFVGRVFRAHNPRWAFEPLSGAGAASFGGRFNRKGREALYTSLRPETAWIEAQQAFPVKAQPLTICAYEVDRSDIVDLADQLERHKLSVASEDVACPWEDLASLGKAVPSWAIAERLIAAGNAGALVPSSPREPARRTSTSCCGIGRKPDPPRCGNRRLRPPPARQCVLGLGLETGTLARV